MTFKSQPKLEDQRTTSQKQVDNVQTVNIQMNSSEISQLWSQSQSTKKHMDQFISDDGQIKDTNEVNKEINKEIPPDADDRVKNQYINIVMNESISMNDLINDSNFRPINDSVMKQRSRSFISRIIL